MKLYYFAYPYSCNPQETTKQVQRLVLEILKKRRDILPIIPHFAFASIYGYPKGYTLNCIRDWEFEIIKRCDALVHDPNLESVGVKWEITIARALGKPVYTYQEVLEGKDQ